MIDFKNRKADLTTNQIISIIILIVSFAIILLFFFMLNIKGNIDAESCRNSVVMRSSLPLGDKVVQLQCKTQEVCISKSGDCKNIGKDAIKIKATNKEELLDVITDRIYNCHWQMGSGKLNFLPANFRETNYCAICDMIYFDEGIKDDKALNKISVKDIFIALRNKKASEGTNNMLFDMYGMNSLDSFSIGDKTLDKIPPFDLTYQRGYIIANSMTKQGWINTLISGGSAAVGTGVILLFFGPPGWVIGAAVITAGAAAGAASYAVTGPGDTVYLPPLLYPNNAEIVEKQLKCRDFTTLA